MDEGDLVSLELSRILQLGSGSNPQENMCDSVPVPRNVSEQLYPSGFRLNIHSMAVKGEATVCRLTQWTQEEVGSFLGKSE